MYSSLDPLHFLLLDRAPRREGPLALEACLIWGNLVLETRHLSPGTPLGLGSAGGRGQALLFAPADDLPWDPFPLVRWAQDRPMLQLSPGWSGWCEREGCRVGLDDEPAEASAEGTVQRPLLPGETLFLDLGCLHLLLRLVPAGRRVMGAWRDRLDGAVLATSAAVSGIAGLLAAAVALVPAPLETQVWEDDEALAELLVRRVNPLPAAHPEAPKPADEAGERAKRQEGRVGEQTAKAPRARGEARPMHKRDLDRELAENAGILAALRDGEDADLFGSAALSQDLTGAVGGLVGAYGTQVGNGGLGQRGEGLGGGGQAHGLDGTGTHGRSRGETDWGQSGGAFGEKTPGTISRVGEPMMLGCPVDASIIDGVIKRNSSRIRHCYQRELQRDPELGGKVVVKFTIGQDGGVSSTSVRSSTLDNEAVSRCITGVFGGLRFEKPDCNGVIVVSYPFLFSPG